MGRAIVWSEDFDRQFKKLARKRRQIFDDLSVLLEKFEAGQLPGRAAQGVHGMPVKAAATESHIIMTTPKLSWYS